jgi:TolB-like protein/Tfp pilus assembly protein PilF
MASPPNKLSRFWQELKRRKVIRTITVYAAAAFVILELLSIIIEPLRLPDWTLQFAIVFLCIGFIVAIVLSWIYDFHPEGGVVKTEPAHKVKIEDLPTSSNNWKIASYISFVVIMGLILLNVIPRSGKKEILDKSIAVLPFRNDSPDQERMYFINGTMEAILNNLCMIKDLRVVSRNSVEQYRVHPKPTPVVAEEMDVSYVLEGSGQKSGNRLLLTIQLIVGHEDRHIWSKQYDREINRVEDLIDIQKEIAQLVVVEIEAIITPMEKALIEKIPTSNQNAWDFYQQGKDEHWKFWLKGDMAALERAENNYQKALQFDREFSHAYVGLAEVYWDKHSIENLGSNAYLREEYLDSFLILVNTALSYDHQLAEVYRLRGDYFRKTGNPDRALEEYEKALQFNPNDWKAFRGKGNLYADKDYVMMIENMLKAVSIYHGPELSEIDSSLWVALFYAGFIDLANQYSQKVFELDDDTLSYNWRMFWTEHVKGDFEEALEIAKKSYQIDSNSNASYMVGVAYMYLDRFEDALIYFRKAYDDFMDVDKLPPVAIDAIAGTLWKNGFVKEAEFLFNEQIHILNRIVDLGRDYTYYSYDFASIYAFLGEKDKAYEHLRLFTQRETFNLFHVTIIKNEFLFDSIREEPEFQQILKEIETKYQAEHERVRQWLEENEML